MSPRPPEKKKVFEPRPIGARALKSCMDTLRPWLAESRVLDLFAGQGRFGIAALDEAAFHVTFVESNARTAAALARSLRSASSAEVLTAEVFPFLQRAAAAGQKFEIVFADPPFSLWTPEFSEKLYGEVSSVLLPKAIFLVKHPQRMVASLPSQGYSLWKSTRFGETTLLYFRYG